MQLDEVPQQAPMHPSGPQGLSAQSQPQIIVDPLSINTIVFGLPKPV